MNKKFLKLITGLTLLSSFMAVGSNNDSLTLKAKAADENTTVTTEDLADAKNFIRWQDGSSEYDSGNITATSENYVSADGTDVYGNSTSSLKSTISWENFAERDTASLLLKLFDKPITFADITSFGFYIKVSGLDANGLYRLELTFYQDADCHDKTSGTYPRYNASDFGNLSVTDSDGETWYYISVDVASFAKTNNVAADATLGSLRLNFTHKASPLYVVMDEFNITYKNEVGGETGGETPVEPDEGETGEITGEEVNDLAKSSKVIKSTVAGYEDITSADSTNTVDNSTNSLKIQVSSTGAYDVYFSLTDSVMVVTDLKKLSFYVNANLVGDPGLYKLVVTLYAERSNPSNKVGGTDTTVYLRDLTQYTDSNNETWRLFSLDVDSFVKEHNVSDLTTFGSLRVRFDCRNLSNALNIYMDELKIETTSNGANIDDSNVKYDQLDVMKNENVAWAPTDNILEISDTTYGSSKSAMYFGGLTQWATRWLKIANELKAPSYFDNAKLSFRINTANLAATHPLELKFSSANFEETDTVNGYKTVTISTESLLPLKEANWYYCEINMSDLYNDSTANFDGLRMQVASAALDGYVVIDCMYVTGTEFYDFVIDVMESNTCEDYDKYASWKVIYEGLSEADKAAFNSMYGCKRNDGVDDSQVLLGYKYTYMGSLYNHKENQQSSNLHLLLSSNDKNSMLFVFVTGMVGLLAIAAFYYYKKRKLN